MRFVDSEEGVELTGVLVDGYVGATDKTSALAQRLIVRLTMRLTGDGRNQSRAIRTLVPARGQLEVRRAADAAREPAAAVACICDHARGRRGAARSEEHTSELQSLMRKSYAVFCLQNKNN